jgi:3-hydroxy acid dehydrogenase/malonic semialdehyde reductase
MFTEALRGELAETATRITEMQVGLTRTNIILTRYRGDRKKEKDNFDELKMRSIRPILPDRSCLRWTSQPMIRLRRC